MASTAELKVILSAADNMSGVLKSAGSSVKSLESGLLSAGKVIGTALVGGIGAATAGVGIATKQFASFEKEMNILQATSGASADEMVQLSSKAKALGSDLQLPNTSSAQAAAAMSELAKAGLGVNDVMAASKGVLQLAAAAGIDEASAATLTAGALNAFGLSGNQATTVANELAFAANASSLSAAELGQSVAQAGFIFKATGRPMEELLSSMIVLGNAGLSGSDGATALKNAVQRMVAPTDEAKKVMKQYGIEINDAEGHMKSVPAIIDNLNESLGGLTDEQRNAALATIGQSDGMKALIPLMAAGGDKLREYEERLRTSNAAQEQADARAKGLAGAWAGAKSQLETLATTLGEKFAPAIEAGLRKIGEFIGQAATFAEGLDFSGVATAFETGFNTISTIVSKAIGPAKEAWETFVQSLQGDWSPDPAQIAPFTSAAGDAALAIRNMALALGELETKVSTPGTAINDVALGMRNLGTAAATVSEALNRVGTAADSVGPKISMGSVLSTLAGDFKAITANVLGVIEGFKVLGEAASLVTSAVGKMFEGMMAKLRGDLGTSGELARSAAADWAKAQEIMAGGTQRINDVIQGALLPTLKSVPQTFDEMVAATNQDALELALGMDANLGVKVPQTVAAMAAAVEQDMVSVGDSAQAGMAAFTGNVTTGIDEAVTAGETGGSELVTAVSDSTAELATVGTENMTQFTDGVSTGIEDAATAGETGATNLVDLVGSALAGLVNVVAPVSTAYASEIETGSQAATDAAVTAATQLVTDSGAQLATMPAIAQAGLGPVVDVAATTGAETTAAFDTAIANIPADTSATMSQVSGAVAAEAGPAGGAAAGVGQSIVSGLTSAIQGGIAAVAAAASALVSAAIGAARAAADAHSPSKKTYELGTDLVDGLRNGLGTADGLFDQIIDQFKDFVDAAAEYRGVAEEILKIEEQTKDFRADAQLDAIRREWEMVDVVSEHLRLKQDLARAERDLLPARQAAANADRQIQDITRGSLGQRQDLIRIDEARNKIKLEELSLEEKLVGLKRDSAEAKQIQEQITALRDKDKLLAIQADRIKLTNDLSATNARINREALIEAVRNGEDALIPTKQMIELLQAEIEVWKADESVITNVSKNFVNSQALRIAAIKDESLATAERISAGQALVEKLTAEGLISETTAGKLRDLGAAALTGKGSTGEFFAAINTLTEALGGQATSAEKAEGTVTTLAGTMTRTATPATQNLVDATKKLGDTANTTAGVFDNHMSPAVDGFTTEQLAAMKPTEETTTAMSDQARAAMEAAQKSADEAKALRDLIDRLSDTTKATQTLNDTPPDISTSSIEDAAKAYAKLEQRADDARKAMEKAARAVADDFKKGFNFVSGKATGGHVNAMQPYIVGERGPELFVPGSSGTIVPHDAILPRSAADHFAGVVSGESGGVTQNFNFNINAPVYGVNDMEDVVIRALDRAERRGRR